jgi:hypothetical protein
MKRIYPLGRLVAVAVFVIACDSGGHRSNPAAAGGPDGDRATLQANNDFPVVTPVPVTGGPGPAPVPGGGPAPAPVPGGNPAPAPVTGGPNPAPVTGGPGPAPNPGGPPTPTPTATPSGIPTPNPSPTPTSVHTFSTTIPVSLPLNGNTINSDVTVSGLSGTMVAARFHFFLTTADDSQVDFIDPLLPTGGGPGHVALYSKSSNGALAGANMGTGCPPASSTTFRVESTKAITSGTAPYVDEYHGWLGVSPGLDNAFFGPATGYNGTWTFRIFFTGLNPPVTGTLNCWSVDVVTSP